MPHREGSAPFEQGMCPPGSQETVPREEEACGLIEPLRGRNHHALTGVKSLDLENI